MFPNESKDYRTARDALLKAELALLEQQERVAAMRRKLPLGGKAQDYLFHSKDGPVKMSELFTKGTTLVLYSFMYGPKAKNPCPMCSSMLDALEGNAHHVAQVTNLAVVARSPIDRIEEFAKQRGWNRFTLLSSSDSTYNADYKGEDEKGDQLPMLNVFVKHEGHIHHSWGSEALFAPHPEGQDARHVDMLWPLWHVLDVTPEGRGSFYPKLAYY